MWIDAHLDLAYLALAGRDLRVPCPPGSEGCVSLPALRRARFDLVLATIFTEPGGTDEPGSYPGTDALDEAERAGLEQLEVYRQLEREGEVAVVRTREELDDTGAGARPRLVLLMEGADPIRDPAHAAAWFDRGLRVVGLTWSEGTRYAGGNRRLGPLTAAGREMVRALDGAGIVHDASHLSDEALDGLLGEARGPVVATHSNCRVLAGDSQRHLRDDHIVEIGRRGGVIGLNLFTKFLVPHGRATIDDCVAHVERICRLHGHRAGVGLGSDMDGGFGAESLPIALDHPTKIEALAEALRDRGWSDDEIDGFRRGNWRRLLERALPSSG